MIFRKNDLPVMAVSAIFLAVPAFICFWLALNNKHIKLNDNGIVTDDGKKTIPWKDIKYVYIEKKSDTSNLLIEYQNVGHETIDIDGLNIKPSRFRMLVKECSGKDMGAKICKQRDELVEKVTQQKKLNEEDKKDELRRIDGLLTALDTLDEKIKTNLMPMVIISIIAASAFFFYVSHREDLWELIGFCFPMPFIATFTIFFTYMVILREATYNLPQIKALDKKELEKYEKMVFSSNNNYSFLKPMAIVGALASLAYIIYFIYILC
ncbi:MAG: hypothetical protein MJZ23_04945 [Paludibacteraceae bacterium]|nr:hypothetical protein [Paludibacteraceae bacterium]